MNEGAETIDFFCTSCKVHVEANLIAQHSINKVALIKGAYKGGAYKGHPPFFAKQIVFLIFPEMMGAFFIASSLPASSGIRRNVTPRHLTA